MWRRKYVTIRRVTNIHSRRRKYKKKLWYVGEWSEDEKNGISGKRNEDKL